MQLEKIILNPENLLVNEVVTWLLTQKRETPSGVITLAHLLLVMPTRQATRHLRQALAEKTGACLPPRIAMANDFLAAKTATNGENKIISEIENRGLLAKFLSDEIFGKNGAKENANGENVYPNLFPRLPKNPDFSWALTTAQTLIEVWTLLEENALTMNEVAVKTKREHLPDEERWQELSDLEKRYFAYLRKLKYTPSPITRQNIVKNPAVDLANIEQIILPALADAQPAFYTALENLSAKNPQVKITVLLNGADGTAPSGGVGGATPSQENLFDKFGRPKLEIWNENIRVNLPDEQITLTADAEAQATSVAKFFAQVAPNVALPTLGLVDQTLYGELRVAFAEQKIPVHYAENHQLSASALGRVAAQLLTLKMDDPYSALSAFLREHDVSVWLTQKGHKEFTYPDLLTELDKWQNKYLPRTFTEIYTAAEKRGDNFPASLKCALSDIHDLLVQEKKSNIIAWLNNSLHKIFNHRWMDSATPTGREFIAAAETLQKILRDLETDLLIQNLSAIELMTLLQKSLNAGYQLEPRSDETLQISGWLELQWSPQNEVAIVGFNEGIIPNTELGHTFLPDKLRENLGLTTNRQRTAQDIFLFKTLIDSRPVNGVRIFLQQVNSAGDYSKPSRLLFLCDDNVMPARAKKLYTDAPKKVKPPYQLPREWRLNLPPLLPPTEISITKLKTYLSTPFTFYLRQTFGNEVDDRESEISDVNFGNFCHRALENFARDEKLKHSRQPAEIFNFLQQQIATQIRDNFGKKPPLVIRLQEQAMLARLQNFAEQQAEFTRNGWEIIDVEHELEVELDGVKIKGKIDRLDQHPQNGYRIIDYKTGKTENLYDQYYYFQLAMYKYLVIENKIIAETDRVECGYLMLNDTPTIFDPSEITAETYIVNSQDALWKMQRGFYLASDYVGKGSIYKNDLGVALRSFPTLFTNDVESCLDENWLNTQYELLKNNPLYSICRKFYDY